MELKELVGLTDLETIISQFEEVLGERIHTDAKHTLHTRGVVDGMEIMLRAISKSMKARKLLPVSESSKDK